MHAPHLTRNSRVMPVSAVLCLVLFTAFGAPGAIGGGEVTEGNELTARKVGNSLILDVNLATGVYDIQYSDDLVEWFHFTTESSDGFSFQISDGITIQPKFYKINRISSGNAGYSSGFVISNLFQRVPVADLRGVFSLPATLVKPASLDLAGLERKSSGDRLFLASILALSKIAEDIRSSVDTPYARLDEDIVDAILDDISDGKLDGMISNISIQIGSTGMGLASKVSNGAVASAFEHTRKHMAGLRSLQFATANQPGVFTLGVPAYWSCFYWDGATWQ